MSPSTAAAAFELGPGDEHQDEIIFTGTGTSEGIPRISCLTGLNAGHESSKHPCACKHAMLPESKNRRRNTGLLIRRRKRMADGKEGEIVIAVDVGKFWWEAAMHLLPRIGVSRIDAVVLTHEHHDATGGLDDLRDFSRYQGSIPVYLRQTDLDALRTRFLYLVDSKTTTGGGSVSSLSFHVIPERPGAAPGDPPLLEPFDVLGTRFVPLPVVHGRVRGEPYISLGFRIGNFSYISDLSELPDSTRELMQGSEIVVLDSLRRRELHPSHFSVDQALGELARLEPAPALGLLVGFAHDVEHEGLEAELRGLRAAGRLALEVRPAHDGMRLRLPWGERDAAAAPADRECIQ